MTPPTVDEDALRFIRRLSTEGCIYFIVAGPFVKIGWTRGAPADRLAALQAGCPFPMWVAAAHKASRHVEYDYHLRFTCLRAGGGAEWFHLTGELAQYVEHLAAGRIPMWERGGPEYNPGTATDVTRDDDGETEYAFTEIPF